MSEQSIQSDDMTLKRVFQDFYRVPDYQREYVWGEVDPKGERGDEVEQFLKDIHQEFENATKDSAPEYFIGTVVVCPAQDGVMDLIDGQQRTTTTFLALCAIRDVLSEQGNSVPDELRGQIAASTVDWQGVATHRLRLDLQYEDARGVLEEYGDGKGLKATSTGTRSIANLAGAYQTIREFLTTQFKEDPDGLRRFHGYFTNKVKLIRIQTSSVAKALKIFETINDRGVGLDAMDLLKNLLFMHASQAQFIKLKDLWKSVTDTIYGVREKPLRFLRYFVFSSFDSDGKLLEDEIYDWFVKNNTQTRVAADPVAFASKLLDAAKAYSCFVRGQNSVGSPEQGLINTRYLGGRAFRQHFILLLAGRHLAPHLFSKLALETENLIFVWLVTDTSTKDYERLIIDAAAKLRAVQTDQQFDGFVQAFFVPRKRDLSDRFHSILTRLQTGDMRAYRMRYILAKLTQHFDVLAYGGTGGHGLLSSYIDGKNDIEHILPDTPSIAALAEFGEAEADQDIIQRLGNLCLVEEAVNRALGNKPYSEKSVVYPSSQFLLTKCQAGHPVVGVADRITKTAQTIPTFPTWNRSSVEARQAYLARIARTVWGVPELASMPSAQIAEVTA